MMERLGIFDYANNLKTLGTTANSLLANNPLYTGDNGTGLNADMQTALDMIKQRALQGNEGLTTAKSILGDTATGKYLDPSTNPYLSFYANKALEQSLPTYNTSAINAGRYGSNAYYSGKNDLEGEIMNQIYGGAYNTERQNQLNAAQLLPSIYEMDYNDAAKLLDAGNTAYQAKQQAALAPWQQAQLYQGLLGNNYPSAPAGYGTNANNSGQLASTFGGQGSTNTASNVLGGAAAGYGLGNMFKSSFTPTASASTGTSSVWSNLFPTGAYSGKSLLG
jgi:hypothetical protein